MSRGAREGRGSALKFACPRAWAIGLKGRDGRSGSTPAARGDEAELFEAYSHELIRAVAGAVIKTTPQVIEDACAFAWAQFIEHQPDRDRNWRGWLFRTAQREAWRLQRE